MTSMPLVSVLIASYNYARYLSDAIDSILAQTYPHVEIVVVDDGSTDGSLALLNHYTALYPGKIRLYSHPEKSHQGIIKTYEMGLSQCRGEYVAFLEADDIWEAENLARKVSVLSREPCVSIAYSAYRPFGDMRGVLFWNFHAFANWISTPKNCPIDLFSIFLRRNPVASFSHFLARRQDLMGIRFPKSMPRCLDWWFLSHLTTKGCAYFIPEKLCRWRIHLKSASSSRLNRRAIFKMFVFLDRLYAALSLTLTQTMKTSEITLQNLERHILFQNIVRRRERLKFFKKLLCHPIKTIRFLSYVALHNILVGRQELGLIGVSK